jgi:hypothetical protein
MLETLEAWISFVCVLIFLGTLISWFFKWYGAGLAGIKKTGFWRPLGAAFFTSATTYLIALAALYIGPPVKTLHGLAAGLLLSFFIIKGIYRATVFRALVPWFFFLVSQALAIWLGVELFIGGLEDLIEII